MSLICERPNTWVVSGSSDNLFVGACFCLVVYNFILVFLSRLVETYWYYFLDTDYSTCCVYLQQQGDINISMTAGVVSKIIPMHDFGHWQCNHHVRMCVGR